MGGHCEVRHSAHQRQLLACILFISASAERDEKKVKSHAFDASRAAAGGPETMNQHDLFNIHDLLIVGYYAPMTKGPHLRQRTLEDPYKSVMAKEGIPPWPEDETHSSYEGLKEPRKGAVMLAKIVKDLHPVKECRDRFKQNEQEAGTDDLKLVELQAATAWDCVGVQESDVIVCGFDGRGCGETGQRPLTKIRHSETHKLINWEEMDEYRNFELKIGDKLGACFQPEGTGGPKKAREWIQTYRENATKIFKERIHYGKATQRKTAWLRACSYWSAFHALALRADALGAEFPNQLLGSIVRIVAGGALFCGG